MSLSPILCVVAAVLLWSTGGVFIKATALSALEISFGRSLLAALTVALLTRREGFGINAVTTVAAVLYAGMLLLFVVATKLTTAANAIFLQYTAPIYLLLFEPILYRERLRAPDLIVVTVCVAGMSFFFAGKLRPEDVSGNIAALGSGLCFAFFTLLLRHPEARRVNRASSVVYGNLLLTVAMTPFIVAGAGRTPTFMDAASVAYLGVVQIGLAYTLFTQGIARGVRSLDAGIVGYFEPVLNPLLVFLFIGERPASGALLGGALIVAAVAFHTLQAAARRRPAPDPS